MLVLVFFLVVVPVSLTSSLAVLCDPDTSEFGGEDFCAFSVAMREWEGEDEEESLGPSAGRRGALGFGGSVVVVEVVVAGESGLSASVGTGGGFAGSDSGLGETTDRLLPFREEDEGVDGSGGGGGLRFLCSHLISLFGRGK